MEHESIEKGYMLMDKGLYVEAADLLIEVIKERPDDHLIFQVLCESKIALIANLEKTSLDFKRDTLKICQQSASMKNASANAQINYAFLLSLMRKKEQSLKVLTDAKKNFRDNKNIDWYLSYDFINGEKRTSSEDKTKSEEIKLEFGDVLYTNEACVYREGEPSFGIIKSDNVPIFFTNLSKSLFIKNEFDFLSEIEIHKNNYIEFTDYINEYWVEKTGWVLKSFGTRDETCHRGGCRERKIMYLNHLRVFGKSKKHFSKIDGYYVYNIPNPYVEERIFKQKAPASWQWKGFECKPYHHNMSRSWNNANKYVDCGNDLIAQKVKPGSLIKTGSIDTDIDVCYRVGGGDITKCKHTYEKIHYKAGHNPKMYIRKQDVLIGNDRCSRIYKVIRDYPEWIDEKSIHSLIKGEIRVKMPIQMIKSLKWRRKKFSFDREGIVEVWTLKSDKKVVIRGGQVVELSK